MIMRRSHRNPIITRDMIPDVDHRVANPSSVFNPGAIKDGDVYRLMLRVQDRGRRTYLLPAVSANGINFTIAHSPIELRGADRLPGKVHHFYDPRITRIDGVFHMLIAMDFDSDCRLGLAQSPDFDSWELRGFVSGPNVRNGVLFPERLDGRYLRLERPNRVAVSGGILSGDSITLSESDDLLEWRELGEICSGRPHYWDELIGPGPPPIKTSAGWLLVYHGIATHFAGANIYQVGALLLDLDDPLRVISRGVRNILEPRDPHEVSGQVPNVVFPTGLIAESVDEDGFAALGSEVKLYYGAADTCVCLATTTVAALIRAAQDEE